MTLSPPPRDFPITPLPEGTSTHAVLEWLSGDDGHRVAELFALWNEACKELYDEGIVEWLRGGPVTDNLRAAALVASGYL